MEVKRDKIETKNIDNKKSSLNLENRKKLMVTGVVEVICFDDKIITFDTQLGRLTIKGSELKVQKLDVQNGDVAISGQIDSCVYSTTESKKDKDSIIARLFR